MSVDVTLIIDVRLTQISCEMRRGVLSGMMPEQRLKLLHSWPFYTVQLSGCLRQNQFHGIPRAVSAPHCGQCVAYLRDVGWNPLR